MIAFVDSVDFVDFLRSELTFVAVVGFVDRFFGRLTRMGCGKREGRGKGWEYAMEEEGGGDGEREGC